MEVPGQSVAQVRGAAPSSVVCRRPAIYLRWALAFSDARTGMVRLAQVLDCTTLGQFGEPPVPRARLLSPGPFASAALLRHCSARRQRGDRPQHRHTLTVTGSIAICQLTCVSPPPSSTLSTPCPTGAGRPSLATLIPVRWSLLQRAVPDCLCFTTSRPRRHGHGDFARTISKR